MASGESGIIWRQIRTLWNEGRIGTLPDEQLLEQFADARGEAAEAAFEALVLRHGPTVLRVCRRVLRDPYEAEDAFQATFLILARRAGSIRKREVLGGWLCRVAYRVSARARVLSVRRRDLDPPGPPRSAERPDALLERDDLRAAILDEVHRLPEKYRLPVELCYLEGRSHDEAARQLAWPVGTVRTRLTWARDRLRDRLTRRGLALPVGLIGTSLVTSAASAGIPAALVKATVEAAAGRAVGAAVIRLVEGVLRAMLMSRIKLAILFVILVGPVAGFVLPWTWAQVGKTDPAVAVSPRRDQRPLQDRPQTGVQEEPTTVREVRAVFFRVVDQPTKKPLSGVNLKVAIDGQVVHQLTTDESGRMVIPLPEKEFERLSVTARGDGLVPKRVSLRGRETEVPRSYSLAMERGTSIGGIVRDDEGRPIEGVTVSLYENSPGARGRETVDFDEMIARTDSQGRWHLDLIPAGVDLGRLHFTFSHPEFLDWIDAVNIQPKARPAQLRSRSGVIVLRRGISVAGRVLDRDGHPIAGASVRLGNRFWKPVTTTEADGAFRIRKADFGDTYLTVQGAGHAPEARPVQVRDGLPPFEFRLGPGRTIRGRVVDSGGRPAGGAYVYVARWSGPQTLDWRLRSDAEGRFEWDGAPRDQVSLGVSKEGYRDAVMTIEPTDKEPVLTLIPASPLRIRGTVADAATGKPIETFTVVPGIVPGNFWLVSSAKVHHDGRYEFHFGALGTQPKRLRIEAKGYLPVTSPAHPDDAGEQVFDARLIKGAWIEGVVRGIDGGPLREAEVIVVTVGEGIHISGGKSYQRGYHPSLLTGPDGRFSFSPPYVPYRVITLHDQGYAEASAQQLADLHDLTVEPWGRIEGTLRVGGHPLAQETVIAALDEERPDSEWTRIQNESRAQTDDQGRFVIERVTPGEARVVLQSESKGARVRPDRYFQPTFVDVLPGRAARMELVQEGGRPLVGRVTEPDSRGLPLDLTQSNAYLVPKVPAVPYPPELAAGERREWLQHWRFTDAARTYRQRRRGVGHPLKLQPDGSFRIDEVQPGAYELHVQVKGFAKLECNFSIPEPAAGQGDGVVDLGVLSLKR
jgi:RNA polymerase sigma factor (sigma-70 family)